MKRIFNDRLALAISIITCIASCIIISGGCTSKQEEEKKELDLHIFKTIPLIYPSIDYDIQKIA